VLNMVVCFAGSDRHGLLNGLCYSGQPGTIGSPPCRAQVEVLARRAALHDTIK
jgi:hypothetical protein